MNISAGRGRKWHASSRGFTRRGSWDRGNNQGAWRNSNNFRGGRSYNNQGDRWGRHDFRNQPRQFIPKPELPTKRLSEKDIGVTEYVSCNEGFSGIIKFRYSDFQVSEINKKGEEAQLTNLDPPEPPYEPEPEYDDDNLLSKYNPEILPLETWNKINALVITPKPTEEKVEIDVTGMSKEERTKIHDAVKKVFTKRIVGSTVTVGEQKFVTFQRYRKGIKVDKRVKWVWPHEYLYFIVHKENCDTMDAAQRIAKRLKLSTKISLMGYAGIKDRRAKTSQWFSVRKFHPQKVAESCRQLDGILVGNFSFASVPLKLGMLRGNRFRIALRNIVAPDEKIEESCTSLKERGFINYYGLQRFGTNHTVPTYEIGIKLLKQDFRGAIDSIIASRSGHLDRPENKLKYILEKNPNDLHGALNQIPRNIRLLYLHSYQSLVWNKCVSERIKRYGLKLTVGDMVLKDKNYTVSDSIAEPGNESDSEQDSQQFETEESLIDSINEDIESENYQETESETCQEIESETCQEIEGENYQETESENNQDKDNVAGEKPKSLNPKLKVKVLTQEDIDSGNYSIFDLVLPLPGREIAYPPNMKDYYQEIMTNDGLTLELKNKFRSYNVGGAYRNVITKVHDMKWSIVKYSDGTADLIRSDLDILNEKPEFVSEPNGTFRALILDLVLPPSSYATMALRELMKIDTACDFQAAQNNYFKNPQNTEEAVTVKTEPVEPSEMQCDVASENVAEKRKLSVSEDESVKKSKPDE